jgi:hypothetical protein
MPVLHGGNTRNYEENVSMEYLWFMDQLYGSILIPLVMISSKVGGGGESPVTVGNAVVSFSPPVLFNVV